MLAKLVSFTITTGQEMNEPEDMFPDLPSGKAARKATVKGIIGGKVIQSSAIFSNCRKWRYELWRRWNMSVPGNYMMVVGLNPSTADEYVNDPTVRRCIGHAMRLGYDGLCMTNLFAFRATDPRDMKAFAEPVGQWNDEALLRLAKGDGIVIGAWGIHGSHMDRDKKAVALLSSNGVPIYCFGKTKEGHPRHPLYLRGDVMPELWKEPVDLLTEMNNPQPHEHS